METGKTSKTHSDVKGRDKDNGSEESENVAIACYSNNKKYRKSVFIFTVPRWRKKKGTREPFSYQSQRAEQFHSLCSFQEGRTFSVGRIADVW